MAQHSGNNEAARLELGAHHIIWGPVELCGGSSTASGDGRSRGRMLPPMDALPLYRQASNSAPNSPVSNAQEECLSTGSTIAAEWEQHACQSVAGERDVNDHFQLTSMADPVSWEEDEVEKEQEQEEEAGPDSWPQSVPGIRIDDLLTPGELNTLLAMIPLDDEGSFTSVGSLAHDPVACKQACMFERTPWGCTQGILCDFCHFPHNRKNMVRACRRKRGRYKKLVHRRMLDFAKNFVITQATTGELPVLPMEVGTSVQQMRASILAKIRMLEELRARRPALFPWFGSGSRSSRPEPGAVASDGFAGSGAACSPRTLQMPEDSPQSVECAAHHYSISGGAVASSSIRALRDEQFIHVDQPQQAPRADPRRQTSMLPEQQNAICSHLSLHDSGAMCFQQNLQEVRHLSRLQPQQLQPHWHRGPFQL